ITEVLPGQPAERAGLRAGDIVTSVAGEAVGSADDFRYRIGRLEPGAEAILEVFRDGRMRSVRVTLSELPEARDPWSLRLEEQDPVDGSGYAALDALGLTKMIAMTPQRAEDARIAYRPGVFVQQVAPGSPADEAELSPGMLLLSIGGQPVATPADVEAVFAAAEPGAAVRVRALRWRGEVGRYQASFHAIIKP
ncbi:MAG: PDZ domain-containing protein, partial [Planctomycetota bacterium]